MRTIIIPFTIWLAALQVSSPIPAQHTSQSVASLLASAVALTVLTTAVYRLGIWRQEMENVKHNVAAELARHREESNRNFAKLRQQVTTFGQLVHAARERGIAEARWKAHVYELLVRVEKRVDRLEELEDARTEEAA